MLCPETLSGLRDDTLDIYDAVVEMVTLGDRTGGPLEETRQYAAFSQFYKAAKRLAGTSLSQLKEEGLTTSLTDGE